MKGIFETDIFIKTGLESFNNDFRDKLLNKSFYNDSPPTIKSIF